MHVAEKICSLAHHVLLADIRAMAPYRRRLLAAQLKRLLAICDKVEGEPAQPNGVLEKLNKGERSL